VTPGTQNTPNTIPGAEFFRQNLGEMAPELADNAVDRRITRWFFYAGDEPGHPAPGGLSVQTPCIPDRVIKRCLVTPCITTTGWGHFTDKFTDIIEGNMVPNSQYIRPGFAQEWVWAGEAATELAEQYASPTRIENQWGLIELTALRGMEWQQVLKDLNVTGVFFPKWPYDVPDTNAEVAQVINTKRAELVAGMNEKNKDVTTIYIQCADEMLKAVEQAQARAADRVQLSNIRIGLPDTDPGHKKSFDQADFLYSKRSGVFLVEDLSKGNPANQMRDLVKNIGDSMKMDPNSIAAIVAATVTALKDQEKKSDAPAGKKAA
jgi:hypothetical protein